MNDSSSRTHAVVELKMYRVKDGKLHINFIKFIDLAGSERWQKAGHSGDKCDWAMLEAIVTNYSLTILARVVGNMAALKKPLTGGQKIPESTFYKESAITRILKNSWDGTAFTIFLFCLSQAERNGGESWCTMEFAERCSKLKANVTRPKPYKLKDLMKKY